MTRQPVVAGKFYEESFDELESQIKECFNSKLGPGDLPVKRNSDNKLKALIVPHAGYTYSGACAAWAYKKIGESHFPKFYVILGPNHYNDKTAISVQDWKTPFGIVKTDKDLAIEISEKTNVPIDENAHSDEHSIEVQLPFLQFVSNDNLPKLKVVNVIIGDDVNVKEFSKNLKSVLDDKDCVVIVSSDFTHYGRAYGYIPFSLDIEKNLKEMDIKTIELIKQKNIIEYVNHLNSSGTTVCGKLPILILMNLFNSYNAKLEMYYTSTAISRDNKNSVSYASITFK